MNAADVSSVLMTSWSIWFVDSRQVIVRHLHGLRCSRCGMEALSPESMRTVESRMREKRSSVRFKRPARAARESGIPV